MNQKGIKWATVCKKKKKSHNGRNPKKYTEEEKRQKGRGRYEEREYRNTDGEEIEGRNIT